MSTDTPFRKTSRTASRGTAVRSRPARLRGTGRSRDGNGGHGYGCTALTGPGNRNRNAAPGGTGSRQTFPRSGGKSGPRAQSRQGIQVAPPRKPTANIQLRFPLFQRARLRRPTGPDSFLAYSIHADFYGTGAARAA